MNRRATAAFVLALVTGALPASEVAAQETELEEGYFELSADRLPGRALVAVVVTPTGDILFNTADVVSHLGIALRPTEGGLHLEWPPQAWDTQVDFEARTIVRGARADTIAEAQWLVRDGSLHLSAEALSDLVLAEVRANWSLLSAAVVGRDDFPSALRLENERRRSVGVVRGGRLAEPVYDGIGLKNVSGGLAGDWRFSASRSGGQARGGLQSSFGTSMLGGGLDAGVTMTVLGPDEGSFADARIRFNRAFPESRLVRYLEVGSLLSSGPVTRRVVGASVSNAPLRTPRSFGSTLVRPTVPTGWEYEVYQGEQLVGVGRANDRSGIETPLDYGNTPVRVRLIGPSGQERTENLVYVVPAARVPTREWRYTLGGGRCQDDCDSYFFGEVSTGIASWMTLAAGTQHVAEGGDRALIPYALAGISPRPGFNLDLLGQTNSLFRVSASHTSFRDGSLSGSYTWQGEAAGIRTIPGWSAQVAASRALPLFGRRWTTATVHLRGQERGHVDAWQASMTTRARRALLNVGYESGFQARDLMTAGAYVTPAPFASPILRDLAWSIDLAASSTNLERLELGASIRPYGSTLVDTRLRFARGYTTTFSLGVTVRTGGGRASLRSSAGAVSSHFFTADGGFAYSRDYGLHPVRSGSVGQAGIAGEVFYDDDGDGLLGLDERAAVDAVVVVDGRRVSVDSAGRFRSWEAVAYEGSWVDVDPVTIAPQWTTPGVQLVRPSPNRFNEVSIPLYRTKEMLGRVEALDGRALAGVGVELVDDAGRIVLQTRSYSDGVFYFERVRPGSYEMRVSDSSRVALGVSGEAPRFIVEVALDAEDPIEVPAIALDASR